MDQKTETPVITAETLKQIASNLAEIGRTYPPDFIGALTETANQSLSDWLKANQIPQQIIDLQDDIIMLDRAFENLRNGNLSDWDASALPDRVARVSRAIIDLGGSFVGAGTVWGDHTPIEWSKK
jgi:hypothetical protein